MDKQKLEELKTNWAAQAAEIKRQEEENRKKLQGLFHASVKDAFEAFPSVYALHWTQYTPYWADGEPCEFSVNTMCALTEAHIMAIKDSEEEDFEETDGLDEILAGSRYEIEETGWSSYYLGKWTKKEYQDKHFADAPDGMREFLQFLKDLPSDLYLAVFGDHVKVVITRQGTTVTGYEHD